MKNENAAKQQFLKAKDVAQDFFGGTISYGKVLTMTKAGILPAKKFGRVYYYTLDALNNWAEKNINSPAWKGMSK